MLSSLRARVIDVYFQRGLHLPELDLWLDPWDAKPWAFVSHAHADHFARHESALCSDGTAALVHARFGLAESRIEGVSFHVPIVRNGFRLRMLPAGHISGSAMLHVTRIHDNASLLYTGDFKTRRGRTAESVNFLSADLLILETTFGLPQYEFPAQMEIEASILRFVHDAFADGETPVLLGYSLGKAQEALALVTEHGIPALLHPTVAAMTAASRAAGYEMLPEPVEFDGHARPGHVVIAPPNALRSKLIRSLKSKRTAMLTGWAMQPNAKYRYRVDEIFPLSDHADHPGLLECVQRVRPKKILTVHGFAREFAAELRGKGMDAWCAAGGDQLELAIQQPGARAGMAGSPRHSRAICGLADFGDLCRLVGETSSRVAKAGFLANYLKNLVEDRDLRLAAVWLTGEALPRKAGRRALHVGAATIRRALVSLPNVREDRYREISLSQNDTARTARLVLQEIPLQPQPVDLQGLEAFFLELFRATGSLERIERLAARLATLHPVEGETVVKLLTGDLRIGLKEGLVEDAIAAAFGADPAAVRHTHMLTGDIGETAVMARHGKLGEARLRPLVPVKCMLASPLERDAEDDRPLFEKLPFTPPFWLEPKYDGIRGQLHKLGNEVALFSRDLRPLDEFPELLAAARSLPGDFILDGELIAFAEGRKLGFADLQKRLGRRLTHGDLFLNDEGHDAAVPLRFIAFDLLWSDGDDLLALPLRDRRMRLDAMQLASPFEGIALHPAGNAGEIETAFKAALQHGHEGLIAKDPDSSYSPGRRGKSWIKLKGVMPTLDCVVVIAEQGHGKRSDVLSDYTFAVRDEANDQLRVIGKAYSGLTDDEIEDLTEHFKKTTIRKDRRRHHVEPQIVLEIAFDAIRASTRHDSGLALRFPRIKAIRHDKTLADIDTLQSAKALL